MNNKLFPLLIGFLIYASLNGQTDTIRLSLPEVVSLAQSDAPDVLIAKTRFTNRYWRYQSILADYKPQIDFQATLPSLNRSIDPITQPDGQDVFIERSLMSNSVGLSLSQNITATGGIIFASTNLERLDILNAKTASYLNNPISINLIQPIFAFNRFKWEKKIEPLRYQEAELEFAEEMEQIGFDAANFFFEVLTQQLNLEAAIREKSNADTLYNIAQGRFSVGRIAETDLLQIELRAMNANANLARARLDLQTSIEELRNFLGIQSRVYFQMDTPEIIPDYAVPVAEALQYARANRSVNLQLDRQLIEADRDVAEAKANNDPDINLRASFGLTSTNPDLDGIFDELVDREVVELGIQIPIADFGKRRARLATARSNQELTRMIVEQERIRFEQDVLLKVQQFDLVREQVALALRSYEVAQKRQTITQNRYLIGKISLTDLNIAIDEREAARRAYVLALRNFWLAHYELRNITLYDFENAVSLVRKGTVEK